MNKTFLDLFTEIAHTVEILAEKVMNYNKSKNDEKGLETAERMRNEYAVLYDTLRDEKFDYKQLTRAQVIRILIGSIIITQNLESQQKTLQNAINGYKDTISKLQKSVDDSHTDEETVKILENLFI